jgi:hypothetical protein
MMEDFCFSTKSDFESEYMFQWCDRRGLHPVLLTGQAPFSHTVKVRISRNDPRFLELVLQLTRTPGGWHFDEKCHA